MSDVKKEENYDILLYGAAIFGAAFFVLKIISSLPYTLAFLVLGLYLALYLYKVGNPKEKYGQLLMLFLVPSVVGGVSHYGVYYLAQVVSDKTKLTVNDIDLSIDTIFYVYSGAFLLGFFGFLGLKFWSCREEFLERLKEIPLELGFESTDIEYEHTKIGTTKSKKKMFLTNNNLIHHTHIVGGTGAGKTNLLKLLISEKIKENKSIIFVDFKAEEDMNQWLKRALKAYDRERDFSALSINSPESSIFYNPVKKGDVNEIVSRVKECFKWSEPFYEKTSQDSLGFVVEYLNKVRVKTKGKFIYDLEDISRLLESKKYFESLEKAYNIYDISKEKKTEFISNVYSDEGQRNTKGLRADFRNLLRSKLGKNLLKTEDQNCSKTVEEIINSKGLFYLQMNSMKDKLSSEIIGKLFLQDLINTVGESFTKSEEKKELETLLIIDEFAAFATPNFIDLLNRIRSAGIGVVLAHQALGDLRVISEDFENQISANTHTKIIFGTKNGDEAERFSSMCGTMTTTKKTSTTIKGAWGVEEEGEKGSVRDTEEFVIHPNVFKSLQKGEAIVIKSLTENSADKVYIDLAQDFNASKVSNSNDEDDRVEDIQNKMKELKLKALEKFKRKYPPTV